MYPEEIRKYAFRLAEQGYKAKDVIEAIQRKFSKDYDISELPPARTVQIWVKTAKDTIGDDYWEFSLDSPPEENKAILACLGYLYKSDYILHGRKDKPKIPRKLADFIVKIYQIAPDIPPEILYHAARLGWEGETGYLEYLLSLAPWRSEGNCAFYASGLDSIDDDVATIDAYLAERFPDVRFNSA